MALRKVAPSLISSKSEVTPQLIILSDSSGAISIVEKKRCHKTCSTCQTSFFFLQYFFRRDDSFLVKIDGERNVADILTKPVSDGTKMWLTVGMRSMPEVR